jgi:GT2 family glycosyltransferase
MTFPFSRAIRALAGRLFRPPAHRSADSRAEYQAWAARRAPTDADLARMRDASSRLSYRPVISIITPVYNTDARWLRAGIESVRRQAYPHWQLCICDDASTAEGTRAVLAECAAWNDERITIVRLERNAHISAASNAALAAATGEFIGLLDHDDELTPDALFEIVAHLNDAPDTDWLYSDEDKLDADGGLSDAYFKPDWSPEHLLSAMYTCHFTVLRRALVESAGGFRLGYEGSQDHDLALRLAEMTTKIRHVPKVLYHWRRTPESTANTGTEKSWASEAGMRALEDTVRRRGVDASVVSGGVPGLYRVKFAIRDEPLVVIVVANSSGGAFTDRLQSATAHPRLEILSVDAAGGNLASAVNAAVRRTRADHVVLLSPSVEPVTDEWLAALLEYSQQDPIGAVGAKIQYPDGRIRHIGLLTGVDAGVARAMHGHPPPPIGYGYFSSAIGVRNYSAVSHECLMTRRDMFERVGGFDALIPWSVADVDYGLKVIRAGRRVVFTPHASLRIREDATAEPAPDPAALDALRARWGQTLDVDPYFNRNLTTADYHSFLSSND